MPGPEITIIVLLAAGVWLWLGSLRVREVAVKAARAACQAEGCQFLDETVSIAGINLTRDDNGQLALRRTYAFEYSDTGDNRCPGSIVMLGQEVLLLNIGLRLVG